METYIAVIFELLKLLEACRLFIDFRTFHAIKPTNALMFKLFVIIFEHAIYQNSNMFQSVLIIVRELLNISKIYMKTWMD